LAVLEDLLAVAPQVVVVDTLRLAPVVAVGVEVDAAAVEAEEVVEAVGVGDGLGRGSQVPLSGDGGPVAEGLEQGGDGLLPGRSSLPFPETPFRSG
jgi:hypothetical protein